MCIGSILVIMERCWGVRSAHRFDFRVAAQTLLRDPPGMIQTELSCLLDQEISCRLWLYQSQSDLKFNGRVDLISQNFIEITYNHICVLSVTNASTICYHVTCMLCNLHILWHQVILCWYLSLNEKIHVCVSSSHLSCFWPKMYYCAACTRNLIFLCKMVIEISVHSKTHLFLSPKFWSY